MARSDQFEEDIDFLLEKSTRDEAQLGAKLKSVRERLVDLYKKNIVKINHSVMEFLCAKELAARGYDVTVEHPLTDTLTCDVLGVKNGENTIVEIESGFVFSDHALDPLTYTMTRVTSKIARYSNYTNTFSLGTLPNNVLNIPELFLKPPRYRDEDEIEEIKAHLDKHYKNPPVSIDEIRQARLHTIYIIYVDEGKVLEIDPEAYIKSTSQLPFIDVLESKYVARLSR